MAFRLPRRLELGRKRPLGRGGNLVALAGLSALLVSSAQAQIVIGGHGGPAVTVDNSVLERLGPPLTLPQLFRGEHNPGAVKRQVASDHRSIHNAAPSHRRGKPVATRSKHPASRETAVVKTAPSHPLAPVKTASSLNQIIHLIPPKSRIARAEAIPAAEERHAPITHPEAAISAQTKASVAALTAPVPSPAPRPPTNRDVPTPTMVPPQPGRDEPMPASVAPPSQPPVAAAPPFTASAPAVTATTLPAAMPIVAATSAPSSPVASATAAATPPVQMAAATTIGNAASAVKFKPGASELGSGPQPVLDGIANRLLANGGLRVQIVSHATGGADDAMEARRVSLARAVAVRAYLIDKGVRSLRIDVRALGNRADSGPVADQVDLLVVSQ